MEYAAAVIQAAPDGLRVLDAQGSLPHVGERDVGDVDRRALGQADAEAIGGGLRNRLRRSPAW